MISKGHDLIVLLIEDNDDHAEIVQRGFDEHRVANRLIRVKDGEEALMYLFRRGMYADDMKYPLPNIIILDLRLPKVDGLEVLKLAKSTGELKHIPVVVLTSSEDSKDISAAYDNYVNSYLVKPLDFDKFNELMGVLDYYWLAWNQKPF
jgi:CheY-like chemotaxis protein